MTNVPGSGINVRLFDASGTPYPQSRIRFFLVRFWQSEILPLQISRADRSLFPATGERRRTLISCAADRRAGRPTVHRAGPFLRSSRFPQRRAALRQLPQCGRPSISERRHAGSGPDAGIHQTRAGRHGCCPSNPVLSRHDWSLRCPHSDGRRAKRSGCILCRGKHQTSTAGSHSHHHSVSYRRLRPSSGDNVGRLA